MSAIAYAPEFERAMQAQHQARRAEWSSWAWSLHPDPRYLIVTRGPGHGPYVVGDNECNCRAGSFGRYCKHQKALFALWGGVFEARRELSCR